jgi:hypothetical protein
MKVEAFDGVILSGHKQDAVEVPFDPAERWALAARSIRPGRRGHAVSGKLNGCAFDSFIVARSRKFWLLLPAEVEEQASVDAGDAVRIEIAPGN